MTIFTATKWPTNAELIEDVAKLGYLDGRVADVTYGYGTFWKRWRPYELYATDLDAAKSPLRGESVDFTNLPYSDSEFDAVVFDPPYKLNGTPTDSVDERYGVHVVKSWQDRYELIYKGLDECCRVSKRYVLLKCQDQVCGGKKRWQTLDFANHANWNKWRLEDRFDMLVTPRPQPGGRRQVHAQVNYSTLLVFEKVI